MPLSVVDQNDNQFEDHGVLGWMSSHRRPAEFLQSLCILFLHGVLVRWFLVRHHGSALDTERAVPVLLT